MKNNVPKLRFPEFTDAWEQRKLGEVLSIRNENASQESICVDIELENLESNTGRIIGDTTVRTQTTSRFVAGDILFGRLRPYLNKWWLADVDGVKSGEIWAFRTESKFSNLFAYLIIQTPLFLDSANTTSGTKMPRADWKLLCDLAINIPTLPEQQKIGSFFRQLDSLITLHQYKYFAHFSRPKYCHFCLKRKEGTSPPTYPA